MFPVNTCFQIYNHIFSLLIFPSYVSKLTITKIYSSNLVHQSTPPSDCKTLKDSIPLSSILWVRNDEVISKSNYLTIQNATISDSGKYRCLAANTIGTKYSELKLRIH